MEILMVVLVGIIFMVVMYLLLFKSLFCVIIGIVLLSYGVYLMFLIMGGLKKGVVLILSEYVKLFVDLFL